MLAASRGHVDMTTFLISASADVSAVDIYQRSTLHMVVRHCDCVSDVVRPGRCPEILKVVLKCPEIHSMS